MRDTILSLIAFLCLSAVSNGANDDALRATAEQFVRQVCENDTRTILWFTPMTEEFKALVPNAAAVEQWTSEIDTLFGQLGNVARAEIIDAAVGEQQFRCVDLYYHGTKKPARIRVSFMGTKIAGFHWYIWEEERKKRSERIAWIVFSIFGVLCVVPLLIFVVGLPFLLWKTYTKDMKELSDGNPYQNEYLQPCYTEGPTSRSQFLGIGAILALLIFLASFIFPLLWALLVELPAIEALIITTILLFSMFCVSVPLFLLGFFIEVNDRYLIVRWGIFRFCVLRLALTSIQSAETIKINPVFDFGGSGIRLAGNGYAYIPSLTTTKGVQVRTNTGKRFIVASDNPDHLAKVIQEKVEMVKSQ